MRIKPTVGKNCQSSIFPEVADTVWAPCLSLIIWLDTVSIGGKFTTATFSDCGDKWATDSGWCANGLMLGKNNSDATADNELKIDTLTGRGYSTTASNGKRWRRGGHAIIWGYNTLHVGELYSGLHVMARLPWSLYFKARGP